MLVCLVYPTVTAYRKPVEDYYAFWGKAGPKESVEASTAHHLLVYHSLDVAAVGERLLARDLRLSERLAFAVNRSPLLVRNVVSFFLALHDLGKFAEGFQNLRPDLFQSLRKRKSKKDYVVRHDSLGYLLWNHDVWKRVWEGQHLHLSVSESGDFYSWGDVFSTWVQAVTGHHGKPPATSFGGVGLSFDRHFDVESRSVAAAFVNDAAKLLLGSEGRILQCSDDLERRFTRSSWIISGIAILSDWIGSNIGHFPYCSTRLPLDEYWSTHAIPQADLALTHSGVLVPRPTSSTGIRVLFPGLPEPSPLQEHVSSCELSSGPQLFILEDATGSGKTEAALTLAHRLIAEGCAEGVFVALPTMATANAIYDRVAAIYQKFFAEDPTPSLVLTHGMRMLLPAFKDSILYEKSFESIAYGDDEETASATCVAWLADNRKKSLLAAFGVGTIDQALLAVLPSKHQSLRLLGLGRSVLVLDEVHAYDPYMNVLIKNLLRFQASQGGSAILLSATLPRTTRQEFADCFLDGLASNTESLTEQSYPLITHVSEANRSETPIRFRRETQRTLNVIYFHDEEAAAERLIEIASAGQCACWIRNTVKDAVTGFQRLSQSLGSDQLRLFHARFAAGDRLDIERDVLSTFGKKSQEVDRQGQILVATQVVEQSLDLDFDYMISDLAPIDLLIQRAGRLHRHRRGDRGTPELAILSPPVSEDVQSDWFSSFFPQAAFVYPFHGQLWMTARILSDRGKFTMPDDARGLVEAVFGPDYEDTIPSELKARDLEADGKAKAAISVAQLNGLDLDSGYASTLMQWLDDTLTPTRLGDPTTTLRLARWDGEDLIPWYSATRNAWELSQVNVRRVLVSDGGDHPPELRWAIEQSQNSMLDRCKWSVLVPLTQTVEGWRGSARNQRGEVSVGYDSTLGLAVN